MPTYTIFSGQSCLAFALVEPRLDFFYLIFRQCPFAALYFPASLALAIPSACLSLQVAFELGKGSHHLEHELGHRIILAGESQVLAVEAH